MLSIIVPIFNEQENIPILVPRIMAVMIELKREFEIIFINDGSTDSSEQVLNSVCNDDRCKIINFRKNAGQTAAMMAGIDYAIGDVIIPIDADLQNDPKDIPKLLKKIDEGYDVVSGWRKNRKDNSLKRNLPSRIANSLISKISGVKLHDYGCSLKAYKKEVIKGVRLYGEMHRFIPIYASWQGAKVTEVVVNHYPRQFGVSKYGLERILKVVLDLIVVKFLAKYSSKPIYPFGFFAVLNFAISIISAAYSFFLKYFEQVSFIQTPLPLISLLSFSVGIISIMLGLVAEMLMRTYYESQDKRVYIIKNTKLS